MVNDVRALCESGKAARVLKVYCISLRYLVLFIQTYICYGKYIVGGTWDFLQCLCVLSQPGVT